MSEEIELKLSLAPRAMPKLRRHPLFANAKRQGRSATLLNTYFDTPERALYKNRIALRTRHHGYTLLQTVKCASPSTAGLTQRPEWEQPFTGVFDFSAIDDPAVVRVLRHHRKNLQAFFTTHFKRETREYSPHPGVRILLMLDHGEISAADKKETLYELELELVEGSPLDLLQLASQLIEELPLFPCNFSKAERGYRLRDNITQIPYRSKRVALSASMCPLEAFRSLALSCLQQWQDNVNALLHTPDATGTAEFIHQLRISQRRLLLLLKLFSPVLPPDFLCRWKECLSNNMHSFALVRNLDVLHEEFIAPIPSWNEQMQTALSALSQAVLQQRDKARASAFESLRTPKQAQLLISLSLALHNFQPLETTRPLSLDKFARKQLNSLRKRLHRRCQDAQQLETTKLHDVRVAVKQLRYGLDFFGTLLPAKPCKGYLKQLARLQQRLGLINDFTVAHAALADFDTDSQLRVAAAYVLGWQSARCIKVRQTILRDLKNLFHNSPPWQD